LEVRVPHLLAEPQSGGVMALSRMMGGGHKRSIQHPWSKLEPYTRPRSLALWLLHFLNYLILCPCESFARCAVKQTRQKSLKRRPWNGNQEKGITRVIKSYFAS